MSNIANRLQSQRGIDSSTNVSGTATPDSNKQRQLQELQAATNVGMSGSNSTKEKLKLVIRLLPPDIDEKWLMGLAKTWLNENTMTSYYFVQGRIPKVLQLQEKLSSKNKYSMISSMASSFNIGKSASKQIIYSRLYVTLKSNADVAAFLKGFKESILPMIILREEQRLDEDGDNEDDPSFLDSKKNKSKPLLAKSLRTKESKIVKPIVEYAPNQSKLKSSKENPIENTIDQDDDYIQFVKQLKQEAAEKELMVVTIKPSSNEEKKTSSQTESEGATKEAQKESTPTKKSESEKLPESKGKGKESKSQKSSKSGQNKSKSFDKEKTKKPTILKREKTTADNNSAKTTSKPTQKDLPGPSSSKNKASSAEGDKKKKSKGKSKSSGPDTSITKADKPSESSVKATPSKKQINADSAVTVKASDTESVSSEVSSEGKSKKKRKRKKKPTDGSDKDKATSSEAAQNAHAETSNKHPGPSEKKQLSETDNKKTGTKKSAKKSKEGGSEVKSTSKDTDHKPNPGATNLGAAEIPAIPKGPSQKSKPEDGSSSEVKKKSRRSRAKKQSASSESSKSASSSSDIPKAPSAAKSKPEANIPSAPSQKSNHSLETRLPTGPSQLSRVTSLSSQNSEGTKHSSRRRAKNDKPSANGKKPESRPKKDN